MVLQEDLDIVASYINETGYKNNTIMVTGSTGLIGSLIVKSFLLANKKYKLNNKVYALAMRKEDAISVFDSKDKNIHIVENEITQPINVNDNVDYIFHTAAITNSKVMVERPVELIKISVFGTSNVLNFAKEHGTKAVVYLSSLEAYGQMNGCHGVLEDELGYIDLKNVRSCYPESKRMCENLCKCYSAEYGVKAISVRLGQTFGAGVSMEDNRVFAMIAKNVINGKNIVLNTKGKSAHDYCYTTDVVRGILLVAQRGEAGEIYNISNPATYSSIKNMAKFVAKNFNKNVKVLINCTNNAQFSKDSKIRLNTDKINSLGWKPQFGLYEIYDRLIKYYNENM